MRFYLGSFISLLFIPSLLFAQQEEVKDTIMVPTHLEEVIVIGQKEASNTDKPLATIDEYLSHSGKVDMIKRGGYAWEPTINSMTTERTVVTIDGMRIFGACTDKMDPITSYVEISNLCEAVVQSGQEGACSGATVGGSIDLKCKQSQFGRQKVGFTAKTGYETNGNQLVTGADLMYRDSLFYMDSDITFRKSENYYAGGNQEVLFSQFQKLNAATNLGFKVSENGAIKGALIYDKATDVGYPALPMDVSLAEALITSVSYKYQPHCCSDIQSWETKAYYNTITHIMDDTQRPNVPIHMDMPGWSDTYGFYSKFHGKKGKHHLKVDFNSFYNRSLAEMTMYPNNPNENIMFMLTWPDVRTTNVSLFLEDKINLNKTAAIKLTTSISNHHNKIASDFGLQSMRIFYPSMEASRSRVLKSFSGNYLFAKKGINLNMGVGYGERAPSVSEAFGFYLFNSFDGYDYVGNPDLKNEKSLEANWSAGYTAKKWSITYEGSYFHIMDYIIGVPSANLVSMTIGGNGVRTYTGLDYASIVHSQLDFEYRFLQSFKWNTQLVYSRGVDSNANALPLITPLSYSSSLTYYKSKFSTNIAFRGNDAQRNYSPFYGENRTAAFNIIDVGVGYNFFVKNSKIDIRLKAENIFDRNYSTFSDWNNIPRKGRNIALHTVIDF